MKIKFTILLTILIAIFLTSCTAAHEVTYKERSGNKNTERTIDNLEKFYQKYKKATYKMGVIGLNAFDCSGFVQKAFKDIYGINLPRSSDSQYLHGVPVRRFKDLKYGDLVFFNTNGRGVSHVGIYLSNKKFIHASTSLGVVKSDITMDYYKERFIEGRRIIK